MNGPLSCFKSFVPYRLRIGLFIVFAIVFQFANVTYISLLGDVAGANQFYKEDISFAYQVSTIGITFIFPLLFRIRFRFTSQQTLIACSLSLALLMLVCMVTTSLPLLLICAFFIGAIKMIGTFETLVSLQLIITPNKDYGVFFSIALGIVLLCGQVTGTTAVWLADRYDWRMMYVIMMLALAAQSLLMLLVMQHFRMVKKLPLYGIDWWGMFHWSILFSLISYVLMYGQVLDWFASEKITVAAFAATLWVLIILYRTFTHRRAFLQPRLFKLRNVTTAIVVIVIAQVFLNTTGSILGPFTGTIMHLDKLHTGALNWWIASGIIAGLCFGFWWFTRINGSFRYIFAIGFAALTLHHALLYFAFSNNAGEQQLCLPYFLKGFGNIVLFAAAGKYMTIGVRPDLFTQMLCYMAMFRNVLGNAITGAFFSNQAYQLSQDYLQRFSSRMHGTNLQSYMATLYNQSIKMGGSASDASILSGRTLYARVSREAMLLAGREIFGRVTVFGFIVLIALALYHFASPGVRQIPSWRKIFTAVRSQVNM